MTIPSTLLLSACVVYGRLAGDLEIIATKSAGINLISPFYPHLAGVLSSGTADPDSRQKRGDRPRL